MDSKLEGEIRDLLNRYNQESGSNTPDFVLAEFVMNCLDNFHRAVNQRETWYGRPYAPPDEEQEAEATVDG